MELKTAIEILEYHQEWRLGKREDMIHEPKKLTEALDTLLTEVKKLLKRTTDICRHVKHHVAEREFYVNQKNPYSGTRIICKKCGMHKFIKDVP